MELSDVGAWWGDFSYCASSSTASCSSIEFVQQSHSSDDDDDDADVGKEGKVPGYEIDHSASSDPGNYDSSDSEEEDTGIKRSSRSITYDPDNPTWLVGMVFNNADQFRNVVRKFIVKKGYDLRFRKNDSEEVRAWCKPGYYFMLYASKNQEEVFQIKTYKPKHKCFKVSHSRTVTTKILAAHFRERVLSRISITAKKLKELGGLFGSVMRCGWPQFRKCLVKQYLSQFCMDTTENSILKSLKPTFSNYNHNTKHALSKTQLNVCASSSMLNRVKNKIIDEEHGGLRNEHGLLYGYAKEFEMTNPGTTTDVKVDNTNLKKRPIFSWVLYLFWSM